MATENVVDNSELFTRLDNYPWAEDQEFQGGLRAILGSVQDPEQVEHLTLRAKCYFYARKEGTTVDFNGYKNWVESHGAFTQNNGRAHPFSASDPSNLISAPLTSSLPEGLAEPPKPASFAEICDMIKEGKPIPGIKEIPNTILEGQSSETRRTERKKPWERDARPTERPSWMVEN